MGTANHPLWKRSLTGNWLIAAGLATSCGMALAAEPTKSATKHEDVVYADADGHKLMLDLFLPESAEPRVGKPPLVVYIHGGSWIRGTRKACPVAWLTGHGFAVASISYRFSHQAVFPAQIHDCKAAVRWLRAHAGEYGYDPARIGVAGSSAGGHLAVLLGTSGEVKELEGTIGGNLDQSSQVSAVVDFYGPADFVLRSRTQPSANKPGSSTFGLLGGPVPEKMELARQASGVTHVGAGDPPLLIFHGDEDRTVLLNQSERLRDAYQAADLDLTLHVVTGAGHGGEPYSSEQNRDRVKDFFSLHLKGKEVAAVTAGVRVASELPAVLRDKFSPPAGLAGDLGKLTSPLRFSDGSMVRTPEEWQRRRTEILKSWHDLMGPWPPAVEKPRMVVLEKADRDGIAEQHIRLEIAPDRMTDGAYLLVPPGDGPFPAVLVVYYDALTGIGRGKAELRDFAIQLAKRGFVALSLGSPPGSYYPTQEKAQLQPLSYHAYVASNCHRALAGLPQVDPKRIGVVGHSYGGKWAMFASCLYEPFACAAWSDGGIVFDEARGNVNYWEPWYLGYEPGVNRKPGIPTEANPRTGAYKTMMAQGRDLHELHALMAPRPFLVSGGSEDQPERWKALNHAIAVNRLLGFENRVAMTNRKGHDPTEESNAEIYAFFEHFLKSTRPGSSH